MAATVSVKPELIQWAIDRSGLTIGLLEKRFPKVDAWVAGEKEPTLRQLEDFARKTMTPLGFLFLDEPPEERIPIPDFRTPGDSPIDRPSPNLIEMIQVMQRRQAWMREFLTEQGHAPLEFFESARRSQNVTSIAQRIRQTLDLDPSWAESHSTWEDALRTLRNAAERIGILVATSSVVGLNNHRPLDPQEFRGFVLCDSIAPLIFLNGADSKSGQMFTLAHELVHVWLGKDGIFNLINMMPSKDEAEVFCNRVAAEFLVPAHKLTERWDEANATSKPFHTIARSFKVSPVVAARRALDLRLISRAQFFAFYKADQLDWLARKSANRKKRKGEPNFYDVQDVRLGRQFATAVVCAAREGRILQREAYQLTDLRGDTFNKYAELVLKRAKDERQ
ncbi:MAG: DNA-binding protein [Planctomycetaceae bacterium]|nr:DNA-binding protein [Planctomycetaceae bacterium]